MTVVPRIVRAAAGLYSGLLVLVIGFQLALVFGAPWGALTQGGSVSGALPATGRAAAAVSAVILLVFALGVLGRVGWGPWAAWRRLTSVVSWVAVTYGVIGVVANAATPSAAERALWLPVAIVLLVCVLVAVLGSRQAVH